MVNETILGGLRIAISHKSSLKDAMTSFYNAGYSKEEVEEATKIIFDEQTNQPKILSSEESKKNGEKLIQKKSSKKNLKLIILLVGVLIVVLGVIIALFIFRDKIF